MVDMLLSNIASYPVLFWLCVITGLAIPVPEDLVLVYAGVMLRHGELEWVPTFIAICAGVWVRDIAAYLIGRVAGDWLFDQPWGKRIFPPARIEKTRKMVTERGLMAVVIGRLLIGMRVPVFMVCGSMRIGFRRFMIVDGIGVVLTTPILIGLGWKFGEPLFEGFRSVMRGTSSTLWALVVVGLVVFVWRRIRTESEPTEEP
ncbi:MAG: membrane protein DedA with SNARE-associated domain [Bradymonadia bacterium]|jgi:membrane protein DedA with SNARE-associated domain